MYSLRQFVIYQLRPKDNGRSDKIPIHPKTFKAHDPHDPTAWLSYEEADTIAKQSSNWGVGFVFTADDPYFFIDVDSCWDGYNWSETSQNLCDQFKGCFVEISASMRGLHIIGRYTGDTPIHGCKNHDLGVDLFTQKRFVALTFHGASGSPDFDATYPLRDLISRYYAGPGSTCVMPETEWTDGPCPEWNGITDDLQLIAKMLKSRSAASAFGGRASVSALWNASDDLAQWFPDPEQGRPFDWSSADAALCQHLAFWTGRDCERIDRLMRMSALVRDKWTEREDYRRRTILAACQQCTRVYGQNDGPPPPPPGTVPIEEGGQYRSGLQFMPLSQQLEYFKGCVYVRDLHRMWTPDGALLKPDQFKAMYGGYLFVLDAEQSKNTKNAWEAFTESRGLSFPKCNSICFRPECTPGQVIYEEDTSTLNTYIPIKTTMKEGNPRPFLSHLTKMLPDSEDRNILLAYMAALVQYPGVKFQWCPVIQGIEGNGKSIIISILAHAVGWRYTHLPNSQDLGGNGGKFNAWISNKLFIGVEEIFVNDRQETIEILKRFITNPRLEIQGKGVDQITGENRANFVMCTNHKQAILKTRKDRRYCMFYTAQQNPEDMDFSSTYFPQLYNWLREEGYAILNNYLRNYRIPSKLNPATYCHRAPKTTSTEEAITLSLGPVEQMVNEAIDEERIGFRGGWVSSMAFDEMLRENRRTISYVRRKEIVESLGYHLHPNLPGGRATQLVTIDRGRPRLYIKDGHPHIGVCDPPEIIAKYVEAQTEGGVL